MSNLTNPFHAFEKDVVTAYNRGVDSSGIESFAITLVLIYSQANFLRNLVLKYQKS